MKNKPKTFLLDVDGVLNDGSFIYTSKGKFGKLFGPDDNDSLKILSKFIDIRFITSDYRGYSITKKRVATDMKFKINLVKNKDRVNWIKKNFDLSRTIFMADGIFDWVVMRECLHSISCKDSNLLSKKYSSFTTSCCSGKRAVSEACMYILKKFFGKKSIEKLILSHLNEA
jgi:3-deoxy-D-manno-octulosonate 8-phosphate phosphatase (KDO 8-P phosphatase)